MPVSAETYERVALEDPEGHWELVSGCLRAKPLTTVEHNCVQRDLLRELVLQLLDAPYTIDSNSTRLRSAPSTFYVPDICVIPLVMERRLRERPGTFEIYEDPLPLVVEVWSPSTGDYDVDTKIPEYRQRDDLEIWRIHPYERTLTAWRRQPDGSYVMTLHQGGAIQPAALPDVTIEIDRLFD